LSYYKDLREHLAALEQAGKLTRIRSEINKDTELHPLIRLQFLGLPEEKRTAFLFENIIDSKGKKCRMPYVVGCAAASRDIYALGMMCEPDEIAEKWVHAQTHPIPPRLVESGPVQEVIYTGEQIKREGITMLPIPISTPGFDNAPYTSASNWITKDPETGVRNVGNYRGQVKAPDRFGCFPALGQGARIHWDKCRAKGIPLQAAMVLGAPPNISYVAISKFAEDVDELAIAGGLAGEPVEIVKCKTVDLEVPAHAEIVVEGIIPTDTVELEGPFGEMTGFMASREISPYMNVTCITHRKNPICQGFISQFPPSESSKIRQISWEQVVYKMLAVDCGMKNILDVALHECSGSWGLCVIRVRQPDRQQTKQIFKTVADRFWGGKMIVLVDEDIDPRNLESVIWAMSFRMQPHRDVDMLRTKKILPLDYSIAPPEEGAGRKPGVEGPESSCLLVDATLKWPYPPTSLPKREIMERAVQIWEREELPPLHLKPPFWGYSLGRWTPEDEEEADMALRGEYLRTGEKAAKLRKKIE
jgi:4-hydroxy-3-polyprenylbenzoate decarboxylase